MTYESSCSQFFHFQTLPSGPRHKGDVGCLILARKHILRTKIEEDKWTEKGALPCDRRLDLFPRLNFVLGFCLYSQAQERDIEVKFKILILNLLYRKSDN